MINTKKEAMTPPEISFGEQEDTYYYECYCDYHKGNHLKALEKLNDRIKDYINSNKSLTIILKGIYLYLYISEQLRENYKNSFDLIELAINLIKKKEYQ